ncbi:MAG: hypothetical protein R2827_00225 [Bdellovibrionales bacterium]
MKVGRRKFLRSMVSGASKLLGASTTIYVVGQLTSEKHGSMVAGAKCACWCSPVGGFMGVYSTYDPIPGNAAQCDLDCWENFGNGGSCS